MPGGAAVGEVRGDDGDEVVYLAMSLHNAGQRPGASSTAGGSTRTG